MERIQNQNMYLTPVHDSGNEYHQGVLDQSVSVNHEGIRTPHEDIQDLYHRNKTFPTKCYRTRTPIIQSRTVKFQSQRDPDVRSRKHKDMILTMWQLVTSSTRGMTRHTLLKYP